MLCLLSLTPIPPPPHNYIQPPLPRERTGPERTRTPHYFTERSHGTDGTVL